MLPEATTKQTTPSASAATGRSTLLVFLITLAALLLTSLDTLGHGVLSDFGAVSDIDALRVLDGDLPYRDFWTLYAPGSMYVLAAAFSLFGREHMVSHVLAMACTALATACLYRLAGRLVPQRAAAVVAALFALAFFHSGYFSYFSTYPPAITCIGIAAAQLAAFFQNPSTRPLLLAGVCIGLAALFKHDLGAYASLAGAAVLLVTPAPPGRLPTSLAARIKWVSVLAAAVLLTILPPALVLLRLTGSDMVECLVTYPATDFRFARPENFPRLPSLHLESWQAAARGLTNWLVEHMPLAVALMSLPPLWRARRDFQPPQCAVLLFALAAFPLFCFAASVQVNTHAVTLTGLAAMLGAAAFVRSPVPSAPAARPRRLLLTAAVTLWALVQLAEPSYRLLVRWTTPRAFIGVPGLRGVRVAPEEAAWLRGLADAMADAAPPDAPVFLAANRNDVVIFCSPLPYWLTPRLIVTRHEQLHPGVTDTLPVQQRMIRDLESRPLPVLLREHRFNDSVLNATKKRFLRNLDIGSTLLDEWIDQHYLPGPRYDIYELMIPRDNARPANDR